ncbi:MAG: Lrp/AsnC ligand binding domain-containing protein [archaeon]|nr:Lrp/AsnC ligand binding domain-containing protein [archaeon]
MPVSFVLINTETDAMEKVLEALKDIKGVKEAYSVYGVYDIIAKVEAENMDKLKDIVSYRIRRLEGIRSALTMIVFG